MLRAIPYPPIRTMIDGQMSTNGALAMADGRRQERSVSPSAVSRTYKTASNLFLTRRLPEALSSLQPLVSSQSFKQYPRALRVKIWSLYLAILDAAAKMSSEEGKGTWGIGEWRALKEKVRDGAIWDEAIQVYGSEGALDCETVVVLTTLLLAHAPKQEVTQKRIEGYLGNAPTSLQDEDAKAVIERTKLIELYLLHILPRVGEWEYALEFTQMSPDLDEEQKEVFCRSLEALQQEQQDAEIHSRELERQREEELDWAHKQAEAAFRAQQSPVLGSRTSRRRASSVRSYGNAASSSRGGSSSDTAIMKRRKPVTLKKSTNGITSKKASGRETNSTSTSPMIAAASALVGKLQAQMSPNGTLNVFRTFLMVAMVAWMTTDRRMRERVRNLLILCWIKLSRTVGMGMKVTYI